MVQAIRCCRLRSSGLKLARLPAALAGASRLRKLHLQHDREPQPSLDASAAARWHPGCWMRCPQPPPTHPPTHLEELGLDKSHALLGAELASRRPQLKIV